jgi:nicotinamide-nucleotide adenylyltransferase
MFLKIKKVFILKKDIFLGEELLACFRLENLKLFNTGKFEVYPQKNSDVTEKNIPHVMFRLFARGINGKYLVQKNSDSISSPIIYKPNLSYEDIEYMANLVFKEKFGKDLLSLRFYKMYFEQNKFCYVLIGVISDDKSSSVKLTVNKSNFYSKMDLKKELGSGIWENDIKEIWYEIIDGAADTLFENMIEEITNPVKSEVSGEVNPLEVGLIIGRFQPPHKGHLHLIIKSLEYVKELKIGIGSSQFSDQIDNPFTYDERKLLLNLSLSDTGIIPKSYAIFPIPDKFDIFKWIDTVIDSVGEFDIIFTNNLWIGRLFQRENKKLVYGLKFDFEKYNGSKIREMIFKNQPMWMELVPKSVYMYITTPEIMKRMKIISKSITKPEKFKQT